MKACRRCGGEFQPTAYQERKSDYICPPCRRASDREWRHGRKSDGRPVVSTKMPREYHMAYEADYYQRAEVKTRRAAQARERSRNPEYAPKIRARTAVRYAIESGRLLKQACFCGSDRVDAHHEDYARPLDVMWLCRKHHIDIHRAKAEGNPR